VLFNAGSIINKCFLLNPEKKLAQIRFVVCEKNAKTHTLILKMTSHFFLQEVNFNQIQHGYVKQRYCVTKPCEMLTCQPRYFFMTLYFFMEWFFNPVKNLM